MSFLKHLFKFVMAACLMIGILVSENANATALDDSELFVEAFNAFQKKDYLLAINKASQITEHFPDTPLRDVSLLLLARSGLKSGDNELAAKTVNRFNEEFADSSLKTSLEDELILLANRVKKGEKLLPNKQLQVAAHKVRNDQLALERAAALKAEQVRLAKEKEERDRIARLKAEEERKERERIAAEMLARANVKLAILLPPQSVQVAAGQNGRFQFDLANNGTEREEFMLSSAAPSEYGLQLASASNPDSPLDRIVLAAGEKTSAIATFKMPGNKVDGHKSTIGLKAVSSKFNDIVFTADSRIITSAPLVRAVVKPASAKVAQGETLKYRISVLNAGSLAAGDLSLRVLLPAQVEIVDAGGGEYRKEAPGVVALKINKLESGNMAEFNLKVKVKEAAAKNEELRCKAEVINNQLNLKETFNSGVTVVQ